MARFSLRLSSLLALSSFSFALLTGCGAKTSFAPVPVAASGLSGKIFGGQQPVANSLVTIWSVGTSDYGSAATELAHTSSGADGTFNFGVLAYQCPTLDAQVYITAQGGNAAPDYTNPNLMLAAGLGACSTAQSQTVNINEVSTAVTAFALAQFFTQTLGTSSTDSFGTNATDLPSLTLSNVSTIPTLLNLPLGTVNPNTTNITIEAAKIYSIANTIAACVNDASDFANCGTLFTNTTPTGGTAPTDTLQAAVQMALYPYQNVSTLYKLATPEAPFVGLNNAPNDWTVGVSYTSASFALGITGTATTRSSATIDIDPTGRIWFPTNASGNTGIAYFDPSSNTFSGPYLAGLFTQPQYVAIDESSNIWATDQASSTIAFLSSDMGSYGHGSVSNASNLGPLAIDSYSNVVFAYTATDSTPSFGEVVGSNIGQISETSNYTASGLAVIPVDSSNFFAFESTNSSGSPCALENFGELKAETSSTCTAAGGVAVAAGFKDILSVASSLNQLCSAEANDRLGECFGDDTVFSTPEGIATDGYGNEWIANSANASVFTFGSVLNGYPQTATAPYLHDSLDGNTMTAPYGIAIDGSGNVWIANAGCVSTVAAACTPGPFVLSELIGAAAPTITPLASQTGNEGASIGTPPGGISIVSAKAPHSRSALRGFKSYAAPLHPTSGESSKPLIFVQ